jgi:phosphate-selective porin
VVKYDWYDPNTSVSEKEIGKAGSNLTPADIKYSTLGFGFIHYLNDNAKIMLWYDKVWNEKTDLPGYTTDIADNIFTCRIQFSF